MFRLPYKLNIVVRKFPGGDIIGGLGRFIPPSKLNLDVGIFFRKIILTPRFIISAKLNIVLVIIVFKLPRGNYA